MVSKVKKVKFNQETLNKFTFQEIQTVPYHTDFRFNGHWWGKRYHSIRREFNNKVDILNLDDLPEGLIVAIPNK